jgi:hypothetical protein
MLAYGETKKYLEPLRSTWEGAEGIIYLCVAPVEEIEGGAFYLDRATRFTFFFHLTFAYTVLF